MDDCGCEETRVICSREGTRKARKGHLCGEGNHEIAKGQMYFYWEGKVVDPYGSPRGTFSHFKMCLQCKSDWEEIYNLPNEFDYCDCYGELLKNVEAALEQEFIQDTDPLALRWFGDPKVVLPEELEAAGQLQLPL